MVERAASFEDIAYALAEGDLKDSDSKAEVGVAILAVFAVGIIASLKFMWDIRHPKTE